MDQDVFGTNKVISISDEEGSSVMIIIPSIEQVSLDKKELNQNEDEVE